MTPAGWTILILTWAIILGLSAFCFYKVLSKRESD